MSVVDYLSGCLMLAATLGASVTFAVVVVRRRLAHLRGAPRLLAGSLIVVLALLAIHLVPLMLTVLSRGTALAMALLVALAALAVPARSAELAPDPVPTTAEPEPRSSWLLVAAAASALAGWLVLTTRENAVQAMSHTDMSTFHLPVIARWLERGSVWHNEQFVPLFANGNYPQNGDVLQLITILPFHQDAFARFAPYPLLGLTIVAIYALARELGAPRTSAWLVGIAFVSAKRFAYPAVEGLPEPALFFGFATGALFLVRHLRTRMVSDLVLAGMALGFAFGTKWYGTSCVIVLVGLWGVMRVLWDRRHVVRDSALVTALIALFGGVWMIRNLVVTPSPIFPAPLEVAGITLFPAPRDIADERVGFSISEYLTEANLWWENFLPAWWHAWGPAVPVALALVVIGAVMCLARRTWPGRAVMLCAVGAAVMLVAYVFTPNSAAGLFGAPILVDPNARYAMPGLLLAMVVAAWVTGNVDRLRLPAQVALAASVPVALTFAGSVDRPRWVLLSAFFLLGATVGAARLRALKPDGDWSNPRKPAVASLAAGVVVAVVVAGAVVQQRQADLRYREPGTVSAWIQDRVPRGSRIGLTAGAEQTRLIYPVFGPRLSNRVSFVGHFEQGMLQRYRTREGFVRALRRRDIAFLLVSHQSRSGRVAREQSWAQAAGYSVIARDRRMVLLERGA